MSHLLAPLAEWIRDVVESLGYAGIAFLIVLENLIPPIPSELVLPFAGYLIDRGVYSPLGACSPPRPPALLLARSSCMALVRGSVARGWCSVERLRGIVRRFGRWIFLREADVDRAEQWFIRHGAKAVLFGRLVPVVRSLVSLPAGVAHMSLKPSPFVLFTAVGSGVWNAILIGFGWYLGTRWETVLEYISLLEYATIALIAFFVLRFVWRRVQSAPAQPGWCSVEGREEARNDRPITVVGAPALRLVGVARSRTRFLDSYSGTGSPPRQE